MSYSINEITFTEFSLYLQDVYSQHPTENLRHHISNIQDNQSSTMLKLTIPTDCSVDVLKMVIGRGGSNLYNLTQRFALDFAWHNRETNEFELYSMPGSSVPIQSACDMLLSSIQYMEQVVASRANPISLDEEPREVISLDDEEEPHVVISLDDEEEPHLVISIDEEEVETPGVEELSFENNWGEPEYINDYNPWNVNEEPCSWDLNEEPDLSPPLFSGAGATPANEAARGLVNGWGEEEDEELRVHWAPDSDMLPPNVRRTRYNSPLPRGWGGQAVPPPSPSFQNQVSNFLDQHTKTHLKNNCDFWLDANDVLTFSHQISHQRMKAAMSLLKVNGFTPLPHAFLLHGEPTQWIYSANNLQESLNTVVSQQSQFERKFVYIVDMYSAVDYWNSLVMKFAHLIDDEAKVKSYIWSYFAFELNLNNLAHSCPDAQRSFHWIEELLKLMSEHPDVCDGMDHIMNS
jgi:hypothetical protein